MCKTISHFVFIICIFFSNIALSIEGIYYIDMDEIMNNSLAGKSIIKQLNLIDESNSNLFKKTEDLLRKEETKIVSQKNILEKNEFDKKIILYKKKILDYKKVRTNKMNFFSRKRNEAQLSLTNKLTPIIADYAEKNSISVILKKQSIIIAKTDLDLTKTIIKILDKQLKTIEIK